MLSKISLNQSVTMIVGQREIPTRRGLAVDYFRLYFKPGVFKKLTLKPIRFYYLLYTPLNESIIVNCIYFAVK